MYRIGQTWTSAATWTSPWGAGGNYSSVGTAQQTCINPTPGTVYTFSPGAGYNFPYGVLFRGATESSITYRKTFYNNPYPTLAVNYTPPAGTANGNIRSWAYLGHYAQGATADHVTRINTDHVSGTYGGVPVDETNIAPNAADGSAGYAYGNSYGTYKWKQGTGSADVVNLLESGFYNSTTKDNGTTYAAVYMYYTGTTSSTTYIGWGSDDDCKVYINGVLRGSFLGDGRGASADNDFDGPFTLTQNTWYRILLKVENGGGGYGLHLRFANANRTARSGCTFYTEDATAPSTPTSLACSGVTSGVWQNSVTSPTFTWTSGTDSQGSGEGVSGVRGQKYYFGTNSGGTPGAFQTGTTYAPGAQSDGTYYFKVDTIDYALNESSVNTFTFRYDGTDPVNPSATCDRGVVNDTWQNTNSAPTFTLSGASDATSGLKTTGSNARYRYYFGTDSNGTPATGTDSTDISPAVSGDGTYYLRVQTQDNAGNWSNPTTVFVFKYDGTAPTVGASPWISGSASFADAKVTLNWTNGSFSDPTPGSGLASLPLAVFEGAADKSGDLAATETDLEIAENVAGGHTYTLKLRDNVGNVAAGPGLTVQVPASADNPWIYTGTGASLSPPGMYPDYANPTKVLTGFNSYKVHGISSGGTPDGAMMWSPFGAGGSVQGRVPVGYFPDATFKAFAGSQDNFVYCIDAAGGTQLWQHDMGSGNRVLRSCAAQFNVSVGGTPYNLIFAGSGNYSSSSNFLRALDAANGNTVWTFGSGYAVGAICGGPAVVPSTNTVYFTSMLASGGGSLWAVNTTDGTLRWSADIGNSDYSVSLNSTGTVVYAANNQGTLYAYNASTGALKWSVALDSGYDVLGAPAFAAGKLYVATAYDRVWCIIDNGATASVNTAWGGGNGYVAIATPSQPVPIVNYYNAVYVGSSDGKLYELSMTDGSVNGYRDLGATTIGDPTVDPSKERIYVGTSDGRVHAFTVPF